MMQDGELRRKKNKLYSEATHQIQCSGHVT